MTERWKQIPLFEGRYWVSDAGRVRRHDNNRILKPSRNWAGYLVVNLLLERRQTRLVHRLVAEAFLGPCPAGHNVNHKDSDRANARLQNLEYVTPKANTQHAINQGGFRPSQCNQPSGQRHWNSKITLDIATQIKVRLAGGERPTAIASDLQVSTWTVFGIKYGRLWV